MMETRVCNVYRVEKNLNLFQNSKHNKERNEPVQNVVILILEIIIKM
jgi:hypothetical protein